MRTMPTVTAILIAIGLWYWFVGRHDGGPAPVVAAGAETAPKAAAAADAADDQQAPVPVIVMASTARPTSTRLVLRGRTAARRNVNVAAETTGRVVSQPLRRGSRVRKDDVLCKLEAGVRAAELAQAVAALAEARLEAEAAAKLKRKGYAADTTLKARQAVLRTAQARLDKVEWDIARLEIKAPFDGVLETDTAELGTLLKPGEVCANVIDLTQIKVAGFVAESEVDLLAIGQSTTARLINGVTAQGSISFVSRVADEKTRTYAVEVTLPNPGGHIRDGMTAELLIDLPAGKAHFIPQSALTLDDAGRLGVRIAEDGIARFRTVKVMRDEADGFWVSGLADKTSVIVVGQEFVRDGRRVVATEAKDAGKRKKAPAK